MATPEPTQISSAQQFKQAREAREAGDILTLASGLSVRIRRPEVTKLIAKGLLPATLVQGFMSLQGKPQDKMKAEDLEMILSFQREVAKHALVSPTIADEPDYDKDEISIDDLVAEDLDEVWAYVNGGLEGVELFRKERDAGLSA